MAGGVGAVVILLGTIEPSTTVQPTIIAMPSNLILPRSALIGRDHEVAILEDVLLQEEIALLTLTGPGGIGKTRLAMQVAAKVRDHFVDGLYFVSLASIRAPALVITAIAQTLGVREVAEQPLLASVQATLHEKQVLLVLDNFEHLLAAATVVSALLSQCQRLKVLVTSRAALHLYGEQEFPVPPLALPDLNRFPRNHASAIDLLTPANEATRSLTEFAAIELFCQRARAVKPDFTLTVANVTDVARICLGLDGLPLAIELAAARVKFLTPAALLARLQQRLLLLTGGAHDLPARQRTLRAEIAWSYDLLTAAEQCLFRRLAIFVGGFTLEAAQSVADANGGLGIAVLDGVVELVDKNLLKRVDQGGDEPRFGMLETIREYGLEELDASGEAEMIQRLHAGFFLALAEATEAEIFGAQRRLMEARLQPEMDNLRAAIGYYQKAQLQEGASATQSLLRLASALAEFMMGSNLHNEARRWLVDALQHASEPTPVRAKALWAAGLMAFIRNDYQIARRDLEESVTLWRKSGELQGLAVALCELCGVAYFQGHLAEAQRFGEESITLFRSIGNQPYVMRSLDNLAYVFAAQHDYDHARTLLEEKVILISHFGAEWYRANAISGLGWLAGQQGDYATARAYLSEALALQRTGSNLWSIAEVLSMLGETVQRQQEFEQAGALYREGLLLAYKLGDKAGMAHFFHHLGTLAQQQREVERATCLFAVAARLRSLSEGVLYRSYTDRAAQDGALAALRLNMDEELFAGKWAEGQALTLDQAVDYALVTEAEKAVLPPRVEGSRIHPAGLTNREVEVLRLLVQGLTYLQIAETLIISRRTVNTHVFSIYSKLGVNSRAKATRFAQDHQLV